MFRASQNRWHGPCSDSPRKRAMPPCAIPQSLRVGAALHGSAGHEHEERIKDGRHVGLDFYDLLIEAILVDIVSLLHALCGVIPQGEQRHGLSALVPLSLPPLTQAALSAIMTAHRTRGVRHGRTGKYRDGHQNLAACSPGDGRGGSADWRLRKARPRVRPSCTPIFRRFRPTVMARSPLASARAKSQM